MKSVRIWSFSGTYFSEFGLNTEDTSYLSVFNPNLGKYGPEKLRIQTLFLRSEEARTAATNKVKKFEKHL